MDNEFFLNGMNAKKRGKDVYLGLSLFCVRLI